MIDTDARPSDPASTGGRRLHRFRLVFLTVVVLGLVGAAAIGGRLEGRSVAAPHAHESAAPPAEPADLASSGAAPAPSPAAVTTGAVPVPRDLLSTAGRVPTHGGGKFDYAPGRGRVLGTKGPVRRFRVAVERGSGEDARSFAAQIEATLGDPRSWVGDGRFRLQRVSAAGRDRADFTVFLATRDTAGDMCARGGTSIRAGRRLSTSCRITGEAIINLDRWRLSAPPYVRAGVPLSVYRQYVINHEVGHELGHHHEGCPRPGGPAPVMVQQTLALGGCVPNPWPRYGNHDLVGPPARD
jgi:hypothetical protein